MTLTATEVLELYPHRRPFRFVDRLLEVDEKHAVGEYTYRPDEFFYEGHFPGHPVTPGTILIETMGQTAMSMYLLQGEAESRLRNLTMVVTEVNVAFSRLALPGETVLTRAHKVFWRGRKLKVSVELWGSDGARISHGTIAGVDVRGPAMTNTAIDVSTRYNEEFWEKAWRRFSFRTPDRLPWWPALKALCDHAPDRLEIGPGVFPRLPIEGTHVIDLSKGALEVLAQHGAIPHQGLLAEQSFPEKSFDVVGLFEVLEHVAEDEALLREIARVTRPGGHLALTVPMGMKHFCSFDRYVGHVRRYEPDELRSKIERAGYALERFEVHEQSPLEPAASVHVFVMRHFPLLTIWALRFIFLPLLERTRIEWHEAGEWEALTRGAIDCGAIFRRTA
jgi:3-hydroxymyristoyl/3-hydroxydecanoyl-(acyl carrier protein) dehydratase/SAM-dependent methyltransferase